MQLYNDYNSYLKAKYGTRVYKIGLDAGFSCPNRDGTKGKNGCLYCDNNGSRASYTEADMPVKKQLSSRIEFLKEKRDAKKFIAYFQAFTNTYGPCEKLKSLYDDIRAFPEIVGLSIGTRPDAVDFEKLDMISSYKKKYEVWIEYGLQSVHEKTLKLIGRGHGFKDFSDAVKLTREFGILICAHVILGLPGEGKDDMMETAKRLVGMKIDGIKIHLLHILKGSALEELYRQGKIKLLEQDEYVELVCDFLENLSPDIIIQRLTGQGNMLNHVAPEWAKDRAGTLDKIKKTLIKRQSYQGFNLLLQTPNT